MNQSATINHRNNRLRKLYVKSITITINNQKQKIQTDKLINFKRICNRISLAHTQYEYSQDILRYIEHTIYTSKYWESEWLDSVPSCAMRLMSGVFWRNFAWGTFNRFALWFWTSSSPADWGAPPWGLTDSCGDALYGWFKVGIIGVREEEFIHDKLSTV